MSSTSVRALPDRALVPVQDTWDLSSLCANDEAWGQAFSAWENRIGEYAQFAGTLGTSPAQLARCLRLDLDLDREAERLGTFASLKATEDTGNSTYAGMKARFLGAASRAAQAASFIRPEIMAIPEDTMARFLAHAELADFQLLLERYLRYRPHTLSPAEERLLAMQTEMAQTAGLVFNQLNNADLKFGEITTDKGTIELSHASFSTCLHSPDRDVRRQAFHQYYEQYAAHDHTIAATLAGSIHKDIYYARARGYSSAREMALFDDNMPISVYDNLISTVREFLPALHRYYRVRREAMGLEEIHHYDTYVPIIADLEKHHHWDQAVELVLDSVKPLGQEYTKELGAGLRGRWCDRYENKGKQSGAFSSGTYDSPPYIMMNYQADVLDHVFTLAHEAGHSMHTWYSARHQPYPYYQYTIFVAEVASTFNETLLGNYLMERARDDRERAYYINRELDGIRGTLFRQTMFAEFEKITHELAEKHEPLTLERFRHEYLQLLKAYFGPDFALDDVLSLECLRIPHFYRAFYVYKYATGLAAAIALAQRVTQGGQTELHDYLEFLKGGCSKFPLDLLRGAGVNMEQPQPIATALQRFSSLVDQLEKLLD